MSWLPDLDRQVQEIRALLVDANGNARLPRIERKLDLILQKETQIVATLDDILTDVTDEGTQIDSLATLMGGLQQQLTDALAGTSPAVQAKVDAIFAAVDANKAKIVSAINTNTPAAT